MTLPGSRGVSQGPGQDCLALLGDPKAYMRGPGIVRVCGWGGRPHSLCVL